MMDRSCWQVVKYWLILLVGVCARVLTGADFYLWQRQWDDRVTARAAEILAETPARRLYILAGELEVASEQWHYRPVAFDRDIAVHERVTPVWRAGTQMLDAPEQLFDAIVAFPDIAAFPRIQLDIDASVRQLPVYGELLRRLRERWPEKELSVTLLPAHMPYLNAGDLLLQSIDFYVLQLHGIEKPQNRATPYALMEAATVERALWQARQLNKPFHIALPTYAYIVSFDANGDFKRLYAERLPENPDGNDYDIAAPDLPLIAKILRQNPDLPVIWFRLPMEFDRLTLDLPTLRRLENLEELEPGVRLEFAAEGNNDILYAVWADQIAIRPTLIELTWPEAAHGECFLLNGSRSEAGAAGMAALPTRLSIRPARCGIPVPVAVFMIENQVRPKIKVVE